MSNASDFIIENGVLTKYVGPGREVVIPEGVTKIGVEAFAGMHNIVSVVIPKGVTTIGDYAFYCCHALEALEIPRGVATIGHHAFNTCGKLALCFWGNADVGEKAFDGVMSVVAPNLPFSSFDTTDAKHAAMVFGYFKNMREYKNAEVLEGYHKYLIRQKKKILPEVLKEDIVELIAVYADNKKITGENFEEDFLNPAIEADAKNCVAFLLNWKEKNSRTNVIEKSIERELVKDPYNTADMKKLWSYEKCDDGIMLTGYKGKETVVEIPPQIGGVIVTSLGDNVFGPKSKTGTSKPASVLKALKSVVRIVIPDGVKSIGISAFERCENLEHIVIPKSVVNIGWRAFCDCRSLKEIVIPEGVEELKAKTFRGCENLETVTLSEGVSKLGNDVFAECEKLVNLSLPNSLIEIGQQTFHSCRSLASVELPSSLKGIGSMAFAYCRGLTKIGVPESVMRISKKTFLSCRTLESAKLSAVIKNIGEDAFADCDALTIHAPAGSYAETYAKENNIPFVAE